MDGNNLFHNIAPILRRGFVFIRALNIPDSSLLSLAAGLTIKRREERQKERIT